MRNRPAILSTLAILLPVILAGCAGSADVRSGPGQPTTVVLISLDGFRWDYVEKFSPPNLSAMAEAGVRAEGLIPVFPTKTFPNHYTMVTGLYPARHGIISNAMYDPERDRYFSLRDRGAVEDPDWWGGEPIWVTAERQGAPTATYFWPGSEAPIKGVRPSHWKPFDKSVPGTERVAQVLAWLDLPPANRPRFISLYFSEVDDAGHWYGPDDPRTGEVVQRLDSYIGQLMNGIVSRGLVGSTNILVVSDHGVAARSPDQVVFLDDYIGPDDAEVIDWSPVLALRPTGMSADSLHARLAGAHPHLRIFRREELPDRFRLKDNPRIMPIVGIADEGWSITRRERFNPDRYRGGDHGYDNALRSMQGVLIALGPAFGAGVRVPPISSVHLYELMTDILDIDAAPNDGSLAATGAMRTTERQKRASISDG